MAEESFRGLAIVAAIGFLVPLLLGFVPKLRLPSVVMEIVVGIVVGPSLLGWVEVDTPIRIMSRIGLASLLFLSGLEIEVEHLRGRMLKLALNGFVLSFAMAVAICYGLKALGFVETPLFVAVLLSCTALGVVLPTLKDTGMIETPFGQLLIIAVSIADFGTVILLALLFSSQGASFGETLLLVGSVAVLGAIVFYAASGLGHWKRLTDTLIRLQESTAMIRVRGASFLLMLFLFFVEKMGLEVILGAFVAGALLGMIDKDALKTHPQFHMRLQAVGFGVFIPIFFVTSGVQFNLRALLESRSALTAVPVFLAAILVIRGVPALLYRKDFGMTKAIAAGLLQATTLSFVVAGVRIGIDLHKMSQGTGAALLSAAILSVLIFPVIALTVLNAEQPVTAKQ